MMNKKSNNLSSRIESDTYNQLVKKANAKGISLNSLVNSILKHYVVWDQFSAEIGFVPITKRTLKKIFRALNEEEIKNIAKDVGGTVPQELIYLSYDTFDFNNLMKMIEISDSRFGMVRYSEKDSIHSINIVHGICENFSKFLVETHQVLADNLSLKFRIEHMDNSMICMEFEKPENSENLKNFDMK